MVMTYHHKATKPPPGANPLATRTPLNGRKVEDVLRGYINNKKPAMKGFLFDTWNAQAEAVRFQELSTAASTGKINKGWLKQWRKDYVAMINEHIDPEWRAAQDSGAGFMVEEMAKTVGIEVVMPEVSKRLEAWIAERGSMLIKELTKQQRLAINNTIRHFVVDLGVGPTDLGKVLRPMIGLTKRESAAVIKRNTAFKELGLSKREVIRRTNDYQGFLTRKRGEKIARTEIASAYNQGALEAVKQAKAANQLAGVIAKRWWTAIDERVCPWCSDLHNTVIGLESNYTITPIAGRKTLDFHGSAPPSHPSCRCTIIYEVWAVGSPVKSFYLATPRNNYSEPLVLFQ